MPLIIRQAREADARILGDLFLKFSDWHLDRKKSIQKAMSDPNGVLLVAELEGEVIALLHQVFFNDPLHAGLNSDITSLFVKEEHRRKGIASQLLKEALEDAKKRNVIEVHVTTRENNDLAIKLYERHGFERAGIVFEKNP